MPSPDSHEHDIPLLGHLERGRKGLKSLRRNIYTTAHMITKQLVFISYHPAATVEQRCDEPHLCHQNTTAPLKGKTDIKVFHSGAASLTAGSVDLNAPEGERGKPYYFCLTERPHRQG